MPPLKPSHFRPVQKSKSISTTLTKPSHFRSVHWNQVNFDPPHRNQVPHIYHVTCYAPRKAKSFSDRTQKPSYFRPPRQKPSQSIPILQTSHFRPAHKDQVNIDPPHKDQVNFDPHTKIKCISISHKNKLISTSTLKLSQYRSPL